jgi:CheY-like chemotaxis protein
MSNKIRIVNSYNINKKVSDSASTFNDFISGIKVLIVDDDKNSGESLRDIIKYRGHDVTLLDEGMKFVNRMNEEKFDIIFMDYHTNDFPESDKLNEYNKYSNSNDSDKSNKIQENITGTYVTKLARECYNFETPVYAYTGDNSTEVIEDFKNSNFKGIFVKPVDSSLINTFFEIIEKDIIIEDNEKDEEMHNSLITLSTDTNTKLRKLSIKNKNFIFFRKKEKKYQK